MAEPADASAKPSKVSTAVGVGCLTLFALPFAGGGTFVLWLALAQFWHWAEASEWVETPARLLAAELVVKRGDGTTYKATARYEYEFAGRQYESERVAVSGGSDNIGAYQESKGRELERLLAAGGRTVCYVDPAAPERALLYRELRAGMLAFKAAFASVFCLAGYGLLGMAWFGSRKAKERAAQQQLHPEQPWLWRADWAAGRIKSQARTAAIGVTGIALFWNLISWPGFLGATVNRKDHEWWLPLIVGLFPLIGTGMAIWAWRLWLVAWRWGTSEFELATLPGVLGGPVAGVIHAPPRIEAPEGIRLTLACIRKVTTGSGKHRRTEERTLWSDERRLGRTLSAGPLETAIPVRFHVPYHLPPSSEEDQVLWRLTAEAKTPGVDYHAQFEIPVFETEASSPEPPTAADEDPLAAYEAPPTLASLVADLHGRIEYEGPDETTLYFPMTRNWGMSLFLLLFAVAWSGACVGLYFSPAPRVFFYVFTAFDALILPMALSMCFSATRLRFGPQRVVVQRRWLVFGREREFPADEIADVAVEASGTTYNGRPYQKVVLRAKNKNAPGKTSQTLLSEIPTPAAARRLADAITAALTTSPGGGAPSRRDDPRNRRLTLDAPLPPELR
ncbi:MAG: DUF3592 domain-containing protein [Pirellulales bacterium]|nr:DUF3592 domain-containing protein [Pirellulales bacterium]